MWLAPIVMAGTRIKLTRFDACVWAERALHSSPVKCFPCVVIKITIPEELAARAMAYAQAMAVKVPYQGCRAPVDKVPP